MPSILDGMRERRTALKAQLDALLAAVETRDNKSFSEDEDKTFSETANEIRSIDKRIDELTEMEAAEVRTAAARVAAGETGETRTGGAQVTDPPIYVPGNGNGYSFFRDAGKRALQTVGSSEAAERLDRSTRMTLDEQRALGNTNATGGSGGEFAPPSWLVDQYISLVRPQRVTAELMVQNEVPAGVSSINLPKVLTGTATAVQSTQNSALAQTDLTTGYVSTGFATIGGKQVVSQQLLDQSAINFDEIITRDLAADYAQRVGLQVLTGAGTGTGTNSVVNGFSNAVIPAGNQVTFTQATPTAAQFYGVLAQAISAIETTRLLPPDAIIMHPRRYWWLASKSDTAGRPLIVPTSGGNQSVNSIGTLAPASAPGAKGELAGIPVYTDANIPTNLGAGTNQDVIYVARMSDLWFYEAPIRFESFKEPYADSVGVLYRAFSYVGTVLNRYGASLAAINGTGLAVPVFG
jgi:HK97 family phage major capsid protein